jgi:phage-related protein
MSARNYDWKLTLDSTTGFSQGTTIVGANSASTAQIANVDNNSISIKVKMDNIIDEFQIGEPIYSNNITTFSQNTSITYSNTSTVALSGTNFIINGNTALFALEANTAGTGGPLGTIGNRVVYKDSIIVRSNGVPVAQSQFNYPALDAVWHPNAGNANIAWGFNAISTNFIPSANANTTLTVQVMSANLQAESFVSGHFTGTALSASANVQSIIRSPYIAEKNAFVQNPIVRLYTVYYPGEWFPTNLAGNPTKEGTGLPWPVTFPFRFAEVRGDTVSDINYRVIYNGTEYTPYPIESSGIEIESTGRVNEVNLIVSNFDNVITTLVEDPFIGGNNTANGIQATVNGELVYNIDPRTDPTHTDFDQDIVANRGGNNVAFDYETTLALNGTWNTAKQDSRDLLGAVVEIRSTFANFLDVWPEYSTVKGAYSNALEVYSTLPYRVGDTIRSNVSAAATTEILRIDGPLLITSNSTFNTNTVRGEKIYIVNEDADSESYTLDSFKINSLDSLDENAATFSLASWLQYFKLQLPKRRFLKNTCSWVYKDEACQYPSNGTGTIPGSSKSATGFYDINNGVVATAALDVCGKDRASCEIRNNLIHYGAFIGTGRTIPR